MKTKKQKQLINERKQIKEKNAELLKRLEDLISLAENEKRDFTEEENKTSNFLNGYMNANHRRLKEIDDKLAVYEVMEDCIDGFIKQLKKEFDIKPKKTVIIRGKDLLDEFKRAEEAKKHEVKRKRP